MKPFAESSVENRQPIFNVIEPLLQDCQTLLEIGSGTGQHAVYFSQSLPHLTWQCSDLKHNHAGINMWIDESGLENVKAPIELDTLNSDWPDQSFDAVFSANTVHIMDWNMVQGLFAGLAQVMNVGGRFLLYGPFNYNGQYSSESNARFDQWLKERDPGSGIKDFEKLDQLAKEAGLKLVNDYEMPVNNRLLYWQKS
jgi:cyclopropane fatty-acyl-phospholipid synthase-like methyltransferase